MIRRILSLLAAGILTSCQPKAGGPDDTTSGPTEDPTGTTMVTCGERVTEQVLTDYESTGTIPSPPCGYDGCGPGEVCVVPGKVCVFYETEGCGNGGIDDSCADDEPGPPPFCATVPPACIEGSTCNGYCLGQELCEDGCGSHSLVDGVLNCAYTFCHCP